MDFVPKPKHNCQLCNSIVWKAYKLKKDGRELIVCSHCLKEIENAYGDKNDKDNAVRYYTL